VGQDRRTRIVDAPFKAIRSASDCSELFAWRRRARDEGSQDTCFIIVCVGLIVGCANMTPQQQRTLSGGAIGAGAGAALGAITAAA